MCVRIRRPWCVVQASDDDDPNLVTECGYEVAGLIVCLFVSIPLALELGACLCPVCCTSGTLCKPFLQRTCFQGPAIPSYSFVGCNLWMTHCMPKIRTTFGMRAVVLPCMEYVSLMMVGPEKIFNAHQWTQLQAAATRRGGRSPL
jgi:hypothetical protein